MRGKYCREANRRIYLRPVSGVEHEKHGCVWHFHGVVRGDQRVRSALFLELTVSDWDLISLKETHSATRNRHGYK